MPASRGSSVLFSLLVLLGATAVAAITAAPAGAQIPYLVKDVSSGEDSAGVFPISITRAGDLLFFRADTEAEALEVWRSDGTDAGTFLLRDVLPGPDTS